MKVWALGGIIVLVLGLCNEAWSRGVRTTEPRVRVLIVDAPKIDVGMTGEYQVQSLKTKQILKQGSFEPVFKMTVSHGQIVWPEQLAEEGLRLRCLQDGAIAINGRRYRGDLLLVPSPERSDFLWVINELTVPMYVKGVMAREVSDKWSMEAIKAQAVVARTYVYKQMEKQKEALYDVKADVSSQVYGGLMAERERTNQAVEETQNFVLYDSQGLLNTYYFACCGGKTERADSIWETKSESLVSVPCHYCQESPYDHWTSQVSLKDLADKMAAWKPEHRGKRVRDVRVLKRSESGRVTWMSIHFKDGSKEALTGNTFRLKVGPDRVRSALFDLERKGSLLEFKGRGWGHGVGLCQWGAKGLSDRGKSYQEILAYYYPKSYLKSI